MDDGAGGTIRKTAASRIKTYAGVSGDVTTIDSLFKTDIKIGEDDQTKIDFETADQINFYAANANQIKLNDGVLAPVADSDVDLGTSSLYFKDAFIDTITTTGTITTAGELDAATGDFSGVVDIGGVASFAAGSVSAPSITRTGDLDTGICFPSANRIDIATAGNQTLSLDANGGPTWGPIVNGHFHWNKDGVDADVRFQTPDSSYAFFIDSGTEYIGFGGDTATNVDTTKFLIREDGQTRFGGLAGNPDLNGGTGYSATNDRTGSFMLNKSGAMNNQNTDSNHYFNYRGATSSNLTFNFRYGGAGRGNIVTGNNSTSFGTSSDYRLKENVDYSWDGTSRLKQLKPAQFNWIDDETNTLVDGFIAHEVTPVVPQAVVGEKDAWEVYSTAEESAGQIPDGKALGDFILDSDGNKCVKSQTVDQSKIVPLLVKTVLELEARIKTLEDA